jgi:hypothetical protein
LLLGEREMLQCIIRNVVPSFVYLSQGEVLVYKALDK